MSLKDDLIAAKALIDTPEKLGGRAIVTSLDENLARQPGNAPDAALVRVLVALRQVDNSQIRFKRNASHADIMALFDRAIEAST